MRARLRDLIRLAAHNDMHLPMRHVLLLAVNVLLGVSGRANGLMRCVTAHGLVEDDAAESSNLYDNALGLNVGNLTQRQQYRAFTVFESYPPEPLAPHGAVGPGLPLGDLVDVAVAEEYLPQHAARSEAVLEALMLPNGRTR